MEKENKIEEVVETVTEEIAEKSVNLPAVTKLDIDPIPVIPAEVMEKSEGLNFKLIAALTGGAAAITGGVIGIRKLIKKQKARKEEVRFIDELDAEELQEQIDILEENLAEAKRLLQGKGASEESEEENVEETPKKK